MYMCVFEDECTGFMIGTRLLPLQPAPGEAGRGSPAGWVWPVGPHGGVARMRRGFCFEFF